MFYYVKAGIVVAGHCITKKHWETLFTLSTVNLVEADPVSHPSNRIIDHTKWSCSRPNRTWMLTVDTRLKSASSLPQRYSLTLNRPISSQYLITWLSLRQSGCSTDSSILLALPNALRSFPFIHWISLKVKFFVINRFVTNKMKRRSKILFK